MNIFVIKKLSVYDNRNKVVPEIKSTSTMLLPDTMYTDENSRPLLYYTNIAKWKETKELLKAALTTNSHSSTRTSGIKTKSSVFGFMPRNALRYNYCRKTVHTKSEVNNWNALVKFAKTKLMPLYLANFYLDAEKKMQQKILKDWKIDETIFTTISINYNQLIKTHTDSFNTKGSLSNVLILKDNAPGGELYLPEYDVYIPQNHGDLTIFRGEEILHGVCKCDTSQGFRASLVFYQLEQLKNCYPYLQELQNAQEWYEQSAKKRLDKRLKNTTTTE